MLGQDRAGYRGSARGGPWCCQANEMTANDARGKPHAEDPELRHRHPRPPSWRAIVDAPQEIPVEPAAVPDRLRLSTQRISPAADETPARPAPTPTTEAPAAGNSPC